ATPGVAREANVEALLLQRGHLVEAENGVRGLAAAARPEELARNELHLPVNPGNADPVISHCTDRPCDVGAVPEVVHAAGHASIVHASEAVCAVQVALEVGVCEINTRVDY